MANRDLTNFRTVINQVVDAPNQALGMAAQFGEQIMRQGQEARITENLSKAQLDLNALQTQYQIDYESNPMAGLEDYKIQRQDLFDRYAEDISPLFRRQWNDNVRNVAIRNDASQQAWSIKQTRVNTVNSVNKTMSNNFKQANIDGQNFGNSDQSEIEAFINFESSKQQLIEFGSKNLGEETTNQMIETYDNDYMKSFISGLADSNPQKAAKLLKSNMFKDMFVPDEINEFEDVIKKNAKRKSIESLFSTDNAENNVFQLVNDPDQDYFSKRLEIDQMEFSGQITTKLATRARRVLTSQKELDAVTNSDDMSEVVTMMYDLNAIQETNSEDYLVGVQNVREEILKRQESGKINANDAQKLNSQLRTLTSQKTAAATQRVGMNFYDANEKFEQLDPQYRGEATRQLFYKTYGKDNLGDKDYNRYADEIINNIKTEIRRDTVERIKKINAPDEDFIKNLGYSMSDVQETAAKYGISEQEVIQKLKAQ